jgi:hypothetical protein
MSDPAEWRQRDIRIATYLYAVGLVVMTVSVVIQFGTSLDAGWGFFLGVGLVIGGALVGPPPTWLRAWGTVAALLVMVLGSVVLVNTIGSAG